MRMSTRGRFGLRALLHLAVCETNAPVSVSSLAETMGVSSDYLMQLFVKLRRAGLIKSIRGPRGGFRLAKKPGEISVGDVVRAVEGPIAVTPCLEHKGSRGRRQVKPPCAKQVGCVARVMWEQLTEQITKLLDAANLQDVVTEARRRGILQ